jgi:hypothetical protein
VPQDRERLWFPSFRRGLLREIGVDDRQAGEILSNIMGRLVGCQLGELDAYLLPESHPYLANLLRRLKADDQKQEKRKLSQAHLEHQWPAEHLDLFGRLGMKWWASTYPSDEACERNPFLQYIKDREFDILYAKGVRDFPTQSQHIVDVSQSLSRSSKRKFVDHVSTITPRRRFYIGSRCRFLTGLEQLRLQSIFFPDEEKLMTFEDHVLRDLSGNAFDGSCCAATIFSCCILVSHGAAFRHGPTFRAERLSQSCTDSSEINSDIEALWMP